MYNIDNCMRYILLQITKNSIILLLMTLLLMFSKAIYADITYSESGIGINHVLTVESGNQFRLDFRAKRNYGIAGLYDLVNDPLAQHNLYESCNGVLFNQDMYPLHRINFYNIIDTQLWELPPGGGITVLEHDQNHIKLQSVVYPVYSWGGNHVIKSMIITTQYTIYIDGLILITNHYHFINDESTSEWRGEVGIPDPVYDIYDEGTSTANGMVLTDNSKNWTSNEWAGYEVHMGMPSWTAAKIISNTATTLTLDKTAIAGGYEIWDDKYTYGWIRASNEDNPLVEIPRQNYDYVFMYWDPNTPEPYDDYTKMSILMARHPDNQYQGLIALQQWEQNHNPGLLGFKQFYWGYVVVPYIPAGTNVSYSFLIQLGIENSAVLPHINNITTADALTSDYLDSDPVLDPFIWITSPLGGDTYAEHDNITIEADAFDNSFDNGSVTQVEFFQNGSSLGTDSTSPYSISWTNVPIGTHTLTAKVLDNEGNSITSPGVSITVNEGIPTGNLALNQPVTVSSTESSSYPAANAVDGNSSTRWSSVSQDPQWIYVDLGDNYMVNRVVLSWHPAYGSAYQIQVSDNASNWSEVYSTSNGDGGIDDITFNTVSARYVRMYGTIRGTAWGYSLYELEVYGIVINDPPTGNLALNKDVTVSSTESGGVNVADNAVDGDTGTRWNSEANPSTPQWIYVDLGTDCSVNQVIVKWYNTVYATNYQIQVSNDASNWIDVYSSTTGDGGEDDITFSTTSARFVRMYATAAFTTWGYSLREFEVYGTDNGNSPPSVDITFPATGATYNENATVTMTASASDSDGSVTQVEFFRNGSSLGLGTVTPPSTYSLSWENVAAGNYTLTAVATDNEGASTISSGIDISVIGEASGNLALNKAITASSTESANPAANVVDGSMNTRWNSDNGEPNPQWIYIDLGTEYSINHVILNWFSIVYATSYQIQVSNDASSWVDVYNTTTGNGGEDDITFSTTNARYVRVLATSANSSWGYSLYEFEVYNDN